MPPMVMPMTSRATAVQMAAMAQPRTISASDVMAMVLGDNAG